MHFAGANLHLKGNPVRTEKSGMQGLIHVRLRHGDIILEPSRNRSVDLMNDPKCRITVLHRIHNDTDGKQIIDLIQGFPLVSHFFVNGKKVLDSPSDFSSNAGSGDVNAHLLDHFVYEFLTLFLLLRNFPRERLINLRL